MREGGPLPIGQLTTIVLVEGVHTGEVDGQGLEGSRQADAALRTLHVEARCRAWWLCRLGQARLGIFHAKYGSRRLGRLFVCLLTADLLTTRKEEVVEVQQQ